MNLIPVTLITGFLGSGKTTLLNHLVCQPELADSLVIINEFGEMALDHMLVAHSTENLIMEMSSGCLCCTIRHDLVKTLRDITWRFARNGQRQFQRVIIETTGLADPAPIIHTLMSHPEILSKYRLDGIVTTIDLATGMNTLDQHQEAIKQAAVADALLLTKADLASEVQRHALLQRLNSINPAATRWEVTNGEISAQHVLNLGLFATTDKTPDVQRWLNEEAYAAGADSHAHHHNHDHNHDVNRHDDRIHAFCYSFAEPISDEVLTAWLETMTAFVGSNILRVKGILNIEGNPRPVVIHGVQHIFHPPVTLPAWPSEDRHSRLVFITQEVGRAMIEKTFAPFRQIQPKPQETIA
ncbi:CobW family GTP-binding protein [Parvibium lacunae]|uniref:GTP-binding protein n=1 Tax=Parvibium lacunae TaxID=1888893 RepID=A0A368L3X0_9BURK|nr:GTP-binding protein [Parvibium lacunae]RCS58122.1 GTP-binding protein [Parvibium lacunae]